jgi:hypothetical protein
VPGSYAHITVANELPHALGRAGGANEAVSAALKYLKYCELGAISPDYPFLVLANPKARWWGDKMHKGNTGALLKVGVDCVRALNGEPRRKALAWLLGYASHVAADMTVHPVVELKVGPYKGNEEAHRTCEMHQDVYIFSRRMNLGLRFAERFKNGIASCGANGELDPDIVGVWRTMLASVYPDEFRDNEPDIGLWHRRTKALIDGIAEEGDRLIPLARHVAIDLALVYPREAEIRSKDFIESLKTPAGPMTYDEVFSRTVRNVGAQAREISNAVLRGVPESPTYATAGVWDLDSGTIDDGRTIYWEAAV